MEESREGGRIVEAGVDVARESVRSNFEGVSCMGVGVCCRLKRLGDCEYASMYDFAESNESAWSSRSCRVLEDNGVEVSG
jgi:hypothetical protein